VNVIVFALIRYVPLRLAYASVTASCEPKGWMFSLAGRWSVRSSWPRRGRCSGRSRRPRHGVLPCNAESRLGTGTRSV